MEITQSNPMYVNHVLRPIAPIITLQNLFSPFITTRFSIFEVKSNNIKVFKLLDSEKNRMSLMLGMNCEQILDNDVFENTFY
jgi:hypothetical protein